MLFAINVHVIVTLYHIVIHARHGTASQYHMMQPICNQFMQLATNQINKIYSVKKKKNMNQKEESSNSLNCRIEKASVNQNASQNDLVYFEFH